MIKIPQLIMHLFTKSALLCSLVLKLSRLLILRPHKIKLFQVSLKTTFILSMFVAFVFMYTISLQQTEKLF